MFAQSDAKKINILYGIIQWSEVGNSVGDGGTHCNVPIHIQGLSQWKRTEFPAAAYLSHTSAHVHAHAPTCRDSLCCFLATVGASSFCAVYGRLKFEPPSASLYRRGAMRAGRSQCVTSAGARGGLQGLPLGLFFCACDVFTFVILTGPV